MTPSVTSTVTPIVTLLIHVTPSVTSDMWQNVTLKLTTNVTVYS